MEKDVVCGMQVDPQKAAGRTMYGGKEYFFCCLGCQKKFEQDPERYLQHKPPSPPVMHQQLVTLGGVSKVAVPSAVQNRTVLHHDPVCGMDIAEQDAAGTAEHKGE